MCYDGHNVALIESLQLNVRAKIAGILNYLKLRNDEHDEVMKLHE